MRAVEDPIHAYVHVCTPSYVPRVSCVPLHTTMVRFWVPIGQGWNLASNATNCAKSRVIYEDLNGHSADVWIWKRALLIPSTRNEEREQRLAHAKPYVLVACYTSSKSRRTSSP